MWAQVFSLCLGVWLMAAPAVVGGAGPVRTSDRIVGPLAAAVAAVALSEVTRPVRRANVVTGAWLLVAPWALGAGWPATANNVAVGVLLIALSFVGGRVRGRYGGGWRAVWAEPGPSPRP